MLSRLFSKKRKAAKRPNRKGAFYRPRMEYLEERALLAQFNWVSDFDGDFGDAGNWLNTVTNLPGVPGPTDDANIGKPVTVTSSVTRTVNSVSSLASGFQITGGTFNIRNVTAGSLLFNVVVDAGATLRTTGGQTAIVGSEISGTINTIAGGTTRFLRGNNVLKTGANLIGAGQYLVAGDVFGGPTVDLQTNLSSPPNFLFQNGILTGTGNLTINGTFDWIQGGSGGTVMSGTGHTIVKPGATLNIGGGNVSLSQRTIDNSGLINYTATGTIAMGSGATINNLPGATFDIHSNSFIDGGAAGGTINNSGLIKKTLGSGTSQIRVTLNNTGTIDVQTGTISFFAGTGTDGTYIIAEDTTLDLTGSGNFTLGGTSTFQGMGTVITGNGTLNVAAAGATLDVPFTVDFLLTNGIFVIPVGANLNFNGDLEYPSSSNTVVRGGGKFILDGVLTHTGAGSIVMAGDLATNSIATTLQILAGGSYQIRSNGGMLKSGGGGIVVNAGAITKAQGTGNSLIDVDVQNSNLVAVLEGTLSFQAVVSNGGLYSVEPSATLRLTNNAAGTFLQTGTFLGLGAGTISLPAGAVTVGAAGGAFNISATTRFIWSGGSITVPVGAVAAFNGNLEVAGAGDVTLRGGGLFAANGNVTQTGVGNLRIDGDGTNTATNLRIAAGRVYEFQNDSGVFSGSGGGGQIDNFGLIRKSAGVGTTLLGATLRRAANIDVDTGTVQIRSQGVVRGGTFNVGAGAVLDLTSQAGDVITYSGAFTGSGAGQVQLNRGSLVAPAAGGFSFNFPAGLFRWTGGSINTNSSEVTLRGTITYVSGNNITATGGGILRLSGVFDHEGTGNLFLSGGTTMIITAPGIYNLKNDSGIVSGGVIQNEGILRKTAGTGLSTVSVLVNNLNLVESQIGTLLLNGGVSQVVGGTLTGGKWSAVSTAVNTATLNLNTNITTIGLAATVTLSGPNSTIPSIANLASNVGAFVLANGASFATVGNLANTGQLKLSSTSILDVTGTFSQTAGSKLTLEMVDGSIGRIRSQGAPTIGGDLEITFSGTPAAVGTTLMILENLSGDLVTGIFAGKPQNTLLSFGGMTWRIRYTLGTGNDISITRMS